MASSLLWKRLMRACELSSSKISAASNSWSTPRAQASVCDGVRTGVEVETDLR